MIAALRRGPTLCILLVIAAVSSTLPVLEMGLNDDWSYTFIARGVARTGHIVYNGWAAPLLGLQVLWSGLLVRLFGFSFTLVRLSTLPFAAGCAGCLYGLARRAGLTHWLATFGSLSIVLSPVFIPLATSYMTDVPGLFFWLATFYCAVRAVSPDTDRPLFWVASAAVVGFAGGTIRQIVWVAPLLTLPCAAWLLRRNRAALSLSAASCCAIIAGAYACMRWYASQTGTTGVPSQSIAETLEGLAEPLRILILSTQVAILPVLVLFLANWRRALRSPFTLALSILGASAYVVLCLWYFDDDLLIGNIVTRTGILWPDNEMFGHKPEVIPLSARYALGSVLSLAAGFALAWLVDAWRHRAEFLSASAPLGRVLLFTVPSTGAYVAALLFRYSLDEILFDRYLIFLTPLVTIVLLWIYQARIAPNPRSAAWVVVAFLALYGVATTHDYIAAGRARLEAANEIVASGVPRTRISAGLEYDGWTQLETAGEVPPLEERRNSKRTYRIPEPYWFWRMTPVIDPVYLVVYSPLKDLRDTSYPPVSYHAWLPPFQRHVLVQKMP